MAAETKRGRALLLVSSVALTIAALTPNESIDAQRPRYAPIVLQVPAGTRATGLGGAFVALRDIESVFANPSLAGFNTGTAFSVARFGDAFRFGTIASSVSLGAFGIAIGAEYLDFRSQGAAVPLSSDVLTRDVGTQGSSLAATVALSTPFKGLRWGAGIKFVEERVGQRGAAPAFDVGVTKEGGMFNTALAVQNIGTRLEYSGDRVDLPLRATLGIAGGALPVGPFDFGASVAVSVLAVDGFVSPAGGMEWSYSPLEGYTFVARVGARRPELREQRPLTAGASFTLDRFTIDYAFEDLRGGAAHRLGLRVR